MDQGVEGGVGEGLAEDFQALLAAAHPGQPVVDQRDPEARRGRPATAGGSTRLPLGCWRPCRPPWFLAGPGPRLDGPPGPRPRAGGYPTLAPTGQGGPDRVDRPAGSGSAHLTSSSSTSKIRVALGGISLLALGPVGRGRAGWSASDVSPTFMPGTPSSQPAMTSPTPMATANGGLPGPRAVEDLVPSVSVPGVVDRDVWPDLAGRRRSLP